MKLSNNNVDIKSGIGRIEIINEHVDDVYALSFIVFPSDVVKCKTQRKIMLENKTQQKVSLTLQIRIETITMDLEHGIMYCKGKVNAENEHVKVGSYHTLDIQLGDKFELYKDNWAPFHLKKLKECTATDTNIIFVIFYEKECVISNVSRNRVTLLSKHDVKNKKFAAIFNTLTKVKNASMIVIASLHDIRNDFYKQMKSIKGIDMAKVCLLKLTLDFKDISNAKVINKILTTQSFASQFQNIQYVEDLREMEDFFTSFAKGSRLVSIGRDEIEEAMDYGAIKILFITDEMFRPSTLDARKNIDKFCEQVRRMNCRICIIPAAHFSGEKLKELGGICAKLEFDYK